MTDNAPVIARIEGRAGRLTLNKPKALHALDRDMCEIMTNALVGWANDDAVDLVIVDHAEGTRGFCAGGDIKLLSDSGKKDGVEGRAFFAEEYRLNTLIHNYKKPYISFLDGVTMGGGVGISVHGSHRIATPNTTFAMPESGIGLFPDVGGGWFLPRLDGELGMWLALTGARLKGEDVLAAGVATHFAPADSLEALKSKLSTEGVGALEGLQTSAKGGFEQYRAIIDSCFSKDSVEEIIAALEADGSEWANKQLAALATKSPTTMKVALRQLRAGGQMKTFEDNMRMEYRIGSRIVVSHDFIEGVRAVVVEKDNAPKWSPAELSGVTEAALDAIFAPVDEELTFLDV
ncbi:MAG: enoyl-CoA hydratase [Hirschia sp.]|nr:enoyl-CoA hydratase [Hirschia sp.]MBF18665.1 enoyl-CoA hydratase [Hirschia sp.]